MSSTLTQKDIDALLRGGATLAEPARTDIAPLNFLVPTRVSRERQTALAAIYGRLALAMQAFLSSRLRAPMDVTVASIEQATFGEFMMSLASPCASFVFRLDHRGTHGVLDLGNDVAYHLVDRLFGGPGDSSAPPRALTALEQSVVRGVAERALSHLRECWQDHLALTPELVGFESNPEMLNVVNRDENVLLAMLDVRTDGFSGTIAWCLPIAVLESFLHEGAGLRPVAAGGSGQARALVEQQLRCAHVTVAVRLPAFRLRMSAITALAEGQTLLTGHSSDAWVDVQVNGRLRFQGSLGQRRRALALRIEKVITPPAVERPAREGRVL